MRLCRARARGGRRAARALAARHRDARTRAGGQSNGTTSKEARARLARAFPALPVAVVDEYRTTDLARGEYWRAHPPRGLRRLLPTSMQVPPVPVDDFVAVILGTRFLAREAQEERGTKL